MVRQISVLGWVLIIFTAMLIISLFVTLFSRLKGKDTESGWITAMRNAGKTIRDPYAEENRKMQELSEKVASIKTTLPIKNVNDNGTLEAGEEE